jgi:hypothetical protein
VRPGRVAGLARLRGRVGGAGAAHSKAEARRDLGPGRAGRRGAGRHPDQRQVPGADHPGHGPGPGAGEKRERDFFGFFFLADSWLSHFCFSFFHSFFSHTHSRTTRTPTPTPQIEYVNLLDAPSSIHWHGQRQVATSIMDGVSAVTQRGVGGADGATNSSTFPPAFLYDFVLREGGAYWCVCRDR